MSKNIHTSALTLPIEDPGEHLNRFMNMTEHMLVSFETYIV